MIDLHTHSNKSDGSLSPHALIKLAKKTGLKALALTDHDSVAGIDEAHEAARQYNIIFIPGVEIEVAFNKGELHLLGLNLKQRGDQLEHALMHLKENRKQRNLKLIEKMRGQGFLVEPQTILAAQASPLNLYNLGRPHFARFLVREGIAKNPTDAFENFLNKGQIFYVPKITLDMESALALIQKAGGVPVLAHPISLRLDTDVLKKQLAIWKPMGLKGIEAFHPSISRSLSRDYQSMAEELGLIITAGSDFHGSIMPSRKLGRTKNGRPIRDELLKPLLCLD